MRKFRVLAVIVILSMLLGACGTPAQQKVDLTLFWHSGGLGDYVVEIAKQYTTLHPNVTVRGDFVPYGPQWHDKAAADFAAKSSAVDMSVFDSQSMSEFAAGGHVVQLDDRLAKSTLVKASDFTDAALAAYSEYPDGSGQHFALPINQDSMGYIYRKDLFTDPAEMAAFKTKYGYDLAVPTTYAQSMDIAEFFTRPDKNLFGIAMYGNRDYDSVSSPWLGVFWSMGAELWDPKTYKAEGFINSDKAIAACEWMKKMYDFGPPGMAGWFYDEVNNAVANGLVAQAYNWFYFMHTHADQKSNPKFFDKMGFADLPGWKGDDGKVNVKQFVGGQGVSISKYSKNIDEAWKFMEWFMTHDIQMQWMRKGAQSGRKDVMGDPEYVKANDFNKFFPTAFTTVRDVWHLAEYPQLLDVQQKYWSLVAGKQMDCKTASDNIAKEDQAILDKIKK